MEGKTQSRVGFLTALAAVEKVFLDKIDSREKCYIASENIVSRKTVISLTTAGSVGGNLSSRARHALGSGGVDNLGGTQNENNEGAETSEGHLMTVKLWMIDEMVQGS